MQGPSRFLAQEPFPMINIASGLLCLAEAALLGMQACANILQHTCVASEGQSGAGMWDTTSRKIHSILTGKVSAAAVRLLDGLVLLHCSHRSRSSAYSQGLRLACTMGAHLTLLF